MQQGLFEALTGHFYDGTSLEAVAVTSWRLRSVTDNLNRIFTTRRGSLSHLPDYGLPDICDAYRRGAVGAEELRLAVQAAICRYEPRLRSIRVIPRPMCRSEFRLVFFVEAQMQGGMRLAFRPPLPAPVIPPSCPGARPINVLP